MDFTEAYPHTCSTVGAAARNGDLMALQALVWNGHPVDVKDNRGWRPIHEAAFHGHPGCLEVLLRQEATDVNWTTFAEETAVLLAARQRHLDCIRVLISAKADVNITTNEGFSPLYEAVQCEDIDCVKTLGKKGANVNAAVYTGHTPLHLAAERGFLAAVVFLILHGADMMKSDDNGLTPVFLAAHMGHIECLRQMLKMARDARFQGQWNQTDLVNKPAADNATPLLIAAQEGHTECVKTLLEFEANPNIPVHDIGAVALQYAVYKNHFRCFELLLPMTDMSLFMSHYSTMHPLVLALERKDTHFVRALLLSRLNCQAVLPFTAKQAAALQPLISHVSRAGGSVLCHVQPDWPLDATRVLLQAGMELNAPSQQQMPPLLAALRHKASRLCHLLLESGATPNVVVPRVCGNVAMVLAILNCLDRLPDSGAVNREVFQDVWTLLLHGAELNSVFQRCAPADGEENGQLSLLYLLRGHGSSKVKSLLLLLLCFCYFVDLPPHIVSLFPEDGAADLHSASAHTQTLAHICRQQILLHLARCGTSRENLDELKLPETVMEFLLYPNVLCGGQLLPPGNANAGAAHGNGISNGPVPMVVDHQ